MSYPPYPPGGGAPGYPPGPGTAPYPSHPPRQPGVWVPPTGGMPAPGYPAAGPALGYGGNAPYASTSSYPPGPPSSGPTPYPGGPPSSGPAPYPPGPPSSGYPPSALSSGYPPGPPSSGYPPGPPSSGYPPGPGAFSAGPSPYPPRGHSSGYPPGPGGYPPGPQPAGNAPYLGDSTYPAQPPPGSAPYPSQPKAPVPQSGPGYSAPPTMQVPTHESRAEAVAVHHVRKKMESVHISKPPSTHGTVMPSSNFDPEKDASNLRAAMKGFGTDEKAIIGILTRRSNQQRQEIARKFKTMLGRDLIKDFKSELGGHLEDVVLGLMMTPVEFSAYQLHKGIEGIGTDEETLIEILCSSSNEEIAEIKHQYRKDFGQDLESDIRSDTSGHFRRLLVSMVTASREPEGPVDSKKAREDAKALYEAGEAKWGTDESVFNSVMCARSYAHLRVVFQEYSKLCRYDIEESISREMSGDLKEGMLTIVKCVRDKQAYYAEKLYKSMKGLGTDDKTLIRIMVSRCEVDMVEIKAAFQKTYRKSLESFIKGDTSGDYRRILLALAGE